MDEEEALAYASQVLRTLSKQFRPAREKKSLLYAAAELVKFAKEMPDKLSEPLFAVPGKKGDLRLHIAVGRHREHGGMLIASHALCGVEVNTASASRGRPQDASCVECIRLTKN
jgi:hypothetical protein